MFRETPPFAEIAGKVQILVEFYPAQIRYLRVVI
jgi:hypothetical protein